MTMHFSAKGLLKSLFWMCVPNDKFDSYTSRSPTAALLSTHGQIFIRLFVQVKCPTVCIFLDPTLLIRFKNAAAAAAVVRKLVSLTLDSTKCWLWWIFVANLSCLRCFTMNTLQEEKTEHNADKLWYVFISLIAITVDWTWNEYF